MFEQSHKMHNDYLLTWVYILKKTFSFQSCALKKLFDQRKENFYLGYLTITNYIFCLIGYLRKLAFSLFHMEQKMKFCMIFKEFFQKYISIIFVRCCLVQIRCYHLWLPLWLIPHFHHISQHFRDKDQIKVCPFCEND